MKIDKNTVVSFHYRMSRINDENPDQESENSHSDSLVELETSYGDSPSLYLHGYQNIMPGLEQSMLGKTEGDIFSVSLEPAQAYGEIRRNSEQRVPLKHLVNKPKGKLKPGDIVGINTEEGIKQATVIKVGLKNVDVDNNHPLAGESIQFDIEVISLRAATADELAHGHAHGLGGHNH